jgi:hypothetical protein
MYMRELILLETEELTTGDTLDFAQDRQRNTEFYIA